MKKYLCILFAVLLLLTLAACGNERKTEYRLQEDGKSYLLYCYAGKNGEAVVIPDTYNGLPVTAIGGGAFMDSGIRSVVLPEGIVSIGEYAFSGCHSLESVTLPSTLTELGSAAFNDCQKLDHVVIPAGVKDLMPGVFAACHSLKNVQLPEGLLTICDEAFEWCYALETIAIPETVTSIGFSAFCQCNSLKEIRVPDSVVYLQTNAFSSCEALESIYLGDNVELSVGGSVGIIHTSDNGVETHDEVFALCPALKSITVSERNPYYSSIDGSFFSKDGTELIRYAVGKKDTVYTIPDSVTKIAQGAFNGCTLDDSSSLETIHISANVTHIAQSVFIGCKALKTIQFAGTTAQWDQAKEDTTGTVFGIQMDDVYSETRMLIGDYGDFTIFCTDGEVSGKSYVADEKNSSGNGDFNFNFG